MFRSLWLARCFTLLLSLAFATSVQHRAHAQGSGAPDLQTARKLFDESRKDQDEGRWDQALRKLQGVASIKETAGIRYHIGHCQEHLGRLLQALDSFQRAQHLADENQVSDVLKLVAPRVEALRLRIPTLTVTLRPERPDATVLVDGVTMDRTLLGTPVGFNPGLHRIEVEVPGLPRIDKHVELIERQVEVIEIPTRPPQLSKPSVSPAPTADTGTVSSSAAIPAQAWVAYGGGLVLGVLGYLAYRHAGSIADDSQTSCARAIACDPERARSVQQWDALALGSWIGAAAGIGLGVTWTVLGPAPSRPKSAIVVSPQAISFEARF